MKKLNGKQYSTRIYLLLVTAWLIYLFLTGLVIGVGKIVYNIPVGYLTREPTTVLNGRFYIGAFSNLGGIIWTVAATLCFFGFAYLKKYKSTSPFKMFFLNAGIFTAVLLFDDIYKLHDEILQTFLGIDDKPTYFVYVLFTCYFLFRFRTIILQTEYFILLASLSLLSLSVFMDQLNEGYFNESKTFFGFSEGGLLIEDTSKGLGILTWCIYFSRTVFKKVFSPAKTFGVTGEAIVNLFKKDSTSSF